MLRFNMREERGFIQKDFRTVDALQVGPVRQLRVPGHDVFLQLIRLAERLLTIVTHVQVLLQVPLCSCSLLPSIPLTPQCKVLSVLAMSLRKGHFSHSMCVFILIKVHKKWKRKANACRWMM